MLTTSLLPWTFSLSYSYHPSLTTWSWQPVVLRPFSIVSIFFSFTFSILLSYLDLISTILSLIFFFFFFTPYSPCLSIHSFGKYSVQGFYFPTSNPDSWVSLKMILQPHMLMPKLNEAFNTSYISLVSFFHSLLKSFVLLCSWLADNLANLFREKL